MACKGCATINFNPSIEPRFGVSIFMVSGGKRHVRMPRLTPRCCRLFGRPFFPGPCFPPVFGAMLPLVLWKQRRSFGTCRRNRLRTNPSLSGERSFGRSTCVAFPNSGCTSPVACRKTFGRSLRYYRNLYIHTHR